MVLGIGPFVQRSFKVMVVLNKWWPWLLLGVLVIPALCIMTWILGNPFPFMHSCQTTYDHVTNILLPTCWLNLKVNGEAGREDHSYTPMHHPWPCHAFFAPSHIVSYPCASSPTHAEPSYIFPYTPCTCLISLIHPPLPHHDSCNSSCTLMYLSNLPWPLIFLHILLDCLIFNTPLVHPFSLLYTLPNLLHMLPEPTLHLHACPHSISHLAAALTRLWAGICNSLPYPLTLVVGSQEKVALPNDHRVQLITATDTTGIAVAKQCGCTLWPLCIAIEIPIPIALINWGLCSLSTVENSWQMDPVSFLFFKLYSIILSLQIFSCMCTYSHPAHTAKEMKQDKEKEAA